MIQDEALRTHFKDDSHIERAPKWLEVDDKIMEEPMSEEESDWKVRDWLTKTLQRVQVHMRLIDMEGSPQLNQPGL